jgi:N-acetylglucosamine-6-phosphate deacetylase
VVTPDGLAERTEVVVRDGVITELRPSDDPAAGVLCPGFVDLQVNGIGSVDVAQAQGSDWDVLDRALVQQGVTTWCPTIISTDLARYRAVLGAIEDASLRAGARPTIAGAHLEGPFLAVVGAHPAEALREPDLSWLGALPSSVRVVTLAPELPGALEAIEKLAAEGVLVALGHTRAGLELMREAAARGARLVTHVFNAMGGLHHRDPGTAGASLTLDTLAVSVIADLEHVHPSVVDLVRRAKAPDQLVLVTDSIAVEPSAHSTAPRNEAGVLAGSRLTMDRAVANAVTSCNVPLPHAVMAASTTPARLLGLTDRGAIAVGARADLVLLDEGLRARSTWIAGEPVMLDYEVCRP